VGSRLSHPPAGAGDGGGGVSMIKLDYPCDHCGTKQCFAEPLFSCAGMREEMLDSIRWDDEQKASRQKVIDSKRFPRVCATCGGQFFAPYSNCKTCSDECASVHWQKQIKAAEERRANPPPPPKCKTCNRLIVRSKRHQSRTECLRCFDVRNRETLANERRLAQEEYERMEANAALYRAAKELRERTRSLRAVTRPPMTEEQRERIRERNAERTAALQIVRQLQQGIMP
jgi:hypothetical protein